MHKTESIKDYESICSVCGKKVRDDLGQTVFDEDADPYCKSCFKKEYGASSYKEWEMKHRNKSFYKVK